MILDNLPTDWKLIQDANDGLELERTNEALARLVDHYGPAVRRYLGGMTKDSDLADELYSQFLEAFTSGAFRRASADRGSFRKYVKTVLTRLYWAAEKKRTREPAQISGAVEDWPEVPHTASPDPLVERLRLDLLALAWDRLREIETASSGAKPYLSVLRTKVQHRGLRSVEVADMLCAAGIARATEQSVRKWTRRAKLHFLDAILQGVIAMHHPHPTFQEVEDELIALNLLSLMRETLESRFGRAEGPLSDSR
jgi:DNA-directed RNA polymerase specialized sigma24 family protein